jgi:CIC family chloride channel protein
VALIALLIVAFGKMITTGLTIGSGGSGGVFGPSMVIGGCIGGAVGIIFNLLFPELVPHPGAYVLVGMAGFFAGAANTPISTIIMVSELTGHYALLLPSLWVCVICYLLLSNTSLYEKQVSSKIDSPAHRGDFHFDVLENMTVGDVVDAAPNGNILTFRDSTPLGEILQRIGSTRQHYFPIVDASEKLRGVLSLDDIREYLYEEEIWNLAIAIDVGTTNPVHVSRRDPLSIAMRHFTQRNVDELPVVAEDDPGRLLAILRRKDVLDTYNREVWRLREEGKL